MPVCSTCNDTHGMDRSGVTVPCTQCPVPCGECRSGGRAPYCETTPCPCDCHRMVERLRVAEAVRDDARAASARYLATQRSLADKAAEFAVEVATLKVTLAVMTAERDAYRSMLSDIMAAAVGNTQTAAVWNRARELLMKGPSGG